MLASKITHALASNPILTSPPKIFVPEKITSSIFTAATLVTSNSHLLLPLFPVMALLKQNSNQVTPLLRTHQRLPISLKVKASFLLKASRSVQDAPHLLLTSSPTTPLLITLSTLRVQVTLQTISLHGVGV